ncbi:protein-glutamine glutaminase family protein [Kitasatospora sp. NPDC093102]|uniref:protein-glutamine glutaminase family protein n=1 Tax=Kitasatospora sp. NPDC093102 TaxID=3155069 RepID=UPI0034150AA8
MTDTPASGPGHAADTTAAAGHVDPAPVLPAGHTRRGGTVYARTDWRSHEPNWPAAVAKAQADPRVQHVQAIDAERLHVWWRTLPETYRRDLHTLVDPLVDPHEDTPTPLALTHEPPTTTHLRAAYAAHHTTHPHNPDPTTHHHLGGAARLGNTPRLDDTNRETARHAASLQATAADRLRPGLPAGTRPKGTLRGTAPTADHTNGEGSSRPATTTAAAEGAAGGARTTNGGRSTASVPGHGRGGGSAPRRPAATPRAVTTAVAGGAAGGSRDGRTEAVRPPRRTRTDTAAGPSKARQTAASSGFPAGDREAGPSSRTGKRPAAGSTSGSAEATEREHPAAPGPARPGPSHDESPRIESTGVESAGVGSGARVESVPADPVTVRRVNDLHRTLSRPNVNGVEVLVLLHHLATDPEQLPAISAQFRKHTGGRSVTAELTRARQDGRLDSGSHALARETLRPGPAEARDLQPPERVMAVRGAIRGKDARRLNTLLRGLRRRVPEVFDLEDGYSDQYSRSLQGDLRRAFDEHAAYFAYLLGHEPGLEAMVLTPAEAQHWHEQAARLTFTADSGEVLPVPFGYPDGCYGRAHVVAKMLGEAGVYSRKVFAVRDVPDGGGLVVESETAKAAMPGAPTKVAWWFHVAAVVLVDDGAGGHIETVIDPSLGHEAMPLRAWLAKMGVHSHARIAGFETTPHEFLEDPHAYLRDAAPRWRDTILSKYNTLPDPNRPLTRYGYPDDLPMVFTTGRNHMSNIRLAHKVPSWEEPSSLRYPEERWKLAVKRVLSGYAAEARYWVALREVRAMLQHPDTTADQLRRHLDTSPFGSRIRNDDLVSLTLRHRLTAPTEPPVTTLRRIDRGPIPGLPSGPPPTSTPHGGAPHPEPFVFAGGAAAVDAATAALWKPVLDDLPVHENLRTVLVPYLGGDGTPHSSTGPLTQEDFSALARAAGWQRGQALRVVFAALHPDAVDGYDHPAYTAYLRHAAHALDHDHPHPDGVDIHTVGALAPGLTLSTAKHTGAQAREKDFTAEGTDLYWGEWVRISTRPGGDTHFISHQGQLHPATPDHPVLGLQKALDTHAHPFTAAPGHPHPTDGIVISLTGTDANPPALAPKPGLFTVFPRSFSPFGPPNTADRTGTPYQVGPGLVAQTLYKRGYHGQDLLWQATYPTAYRATAHRYLLDLATELDNPDIYLPAPGSTSFTPEYGHLRNRANAVPAGYERLTTTPDTPARHTTTDGSLQPRTDNPEPTPITLTDAHKAILDKTRTITPAELEASWNRRTPELMRIARNRFTELTGNQVRTPADAEALHRYAFLRREAMKECVEDALPLLWQELNRKGGVDGTHGASADPAPSTDPDPDPDPDSGSGSASGAVSVARGDNGTAAPKADASRTVIDPTRSDTPPPTDPTPTVLTPTHQAVLEAARTASPATLESCWNAIGPTFRDVIRETFEKLAESPTSRPTDTEALRRYAYLRFRAFKAELQNDVPLLWQHLTHGSGVEAIHDMPTGEGQRMDMKVDSPSPAAGAVTGVEAPAAHSTPETIDPTRSDTPPLTGPTLIEFTPDHHAVLDQALDSTRSVRKRWWNGEQELFKDYIERELDTLAATGSPRSADTEDGLRAVHLYKLAFVEDLEDDFPALWRELKRRLDAENTRHLPGTGRRMSMDVDSPPTTTRTTHDHTEAQPTGERFDGDFDGGGVAGPEPSVTAAVRSVARLTLSATDTPTAPPTRTDPDTSPPSTPGTRTTPAPAGPATPDTPATAGIPAQRVSTDPWPGHLREQAREFLRDSAAGLSAGQLELAQRVLDSVTGADHSAAGAHVFASPAVIRAYRQKIAVYLRRHVSNVDLRTYDPAGPLPLPGPEARLLSIHAARTPSGRPLPDKVIEAVTRTVLHYQRGDLRHEPPTPATPAAPNTPPPPRNPATTPATSRQPVTTTPAPRTPRRMGTPPANGTTTGTGTPRALRLPTITLPTTPDTPTTTNTRTTRPDTPTATRRPTTTRTARTPQPARHAAQPPQATPAPAPAAGGRPTPDTHTPPPPSNTPGPAATRFAHRLTTRLTEAATGLTTHPDPRDPLAPLRHHLTTTIPITDNHLHTLAHTLLNTTRRITPDNLRALHTLTPLLTNPTNPTNPTPHTLTTNLRNLTKLVLNTPHPTGTDIQDLLDITTTLNEVNDLRDITTTLNEVNDLLDTTCRITPDNLRALHTLTPLLTNPTNPTNSTPRTLTTNLRNLTRLVLNTPHPTGTDIQDLLDITTILNEVNDLRDNHRPHTLNTLRHAAAA